MIVVGGGIIGLSCAWLLARKGLTVTLFDARETGAEASWAAAGMLAPGGEFEEDSPVARMALQSLGLYPAYIAELQEASGIEIDYRKCGALDLAFTEDEAVALSHRAARQRILGIQSEIANHPGVAAARFYPHDALVNPRDLTSALRIACLREGVEIREHEPVKAILDNGAGVTTRQGPFGDDEGLLLAAGAWSGTLLPGAGTRPVRGHVIAWNNQPLLSGAILRSGPTYVVQRASGQILAGSTTEDVGFNRFTDPAMVEDIRRRTIELLPSLAAVPVDDAWLGFRPGISGDSPAIGRVPGTNIWTAFGHYRNGILLAPTTAKTITEMVVSGRNTSFGCNTTPAIPK